MATAKKNTKTKSSKVKNTKKKRPASATATEIEQMKEASKGGGKNQMMAIIMFAVAVFLMFVAIINSEEKNAWYWLNYTMFGLFGVCAYIMPVILGVVAVMSAMEKFSGKTTSRIVESGFLIWFICAALDIFSGVYLNNDFISHISTAFGYKETFGGVFGVLLGHPMCALLGSTGAKITIIILIVVILMFLTGTTLLSAFGMISKPIKTAGQVIENRIEEHEKKREENRARFEVDVPIAGENRYEENSLDNLDTDTTKIKQKRDKVIATYRGEDYIEEQPEEVDEFSVDVEYTEPESIVNETETEVAQTENEVKNETVDLKTIPEGVSLNDIPEDEEGYHFPPLDLLKEPVGSNVSAANDYEATGEQLVNILRSFGVETKIINISVGPAITRYELQPAAGVKISKITNLADDIAMNLATAGVRIEAPIPNKPAVGIEVPNRNTRVVTVREIIDSKAFTTAKSKLTVSMGKDIAGTPIVTDIAKMPHGLIAGATGSGKSVCINSIIVSILYNATPDEVKLLMIDPKVVELGVYNGIPHLLVPVVTDPRKAAGALGWAVTEMEKRYKMFAENDVRNLEGYNRLAEKDDNLIKMPQIVIIIDELADLMMTSPKEVEDSICRIAQKARAAGMHLLIATQRPSVDVITGIIKANIPSRIAFAVSSAVDSRTILDMGGAEKLMGKGDMLFNPVGAIKPRRIQGCFVSDDEVEAVVEYIKGIRTDEYDSDIMEEIERQAAANDVKGSKDSSSGSNDADPMLQAAIECVVENGQASTSLLQRRLKLGYARAARIMDEMAERGIVGPYEGSKPRAVLISKSQLLEMQARNDELE